MVGLSVDPELIIPPYGGGGGGGPCFAAGTRLLGVNGPVAVEEIRPGDVLEPDDIMWNREAIPHDV